MISALRHGGGPMPMLRKIMVLCVSFAAAGSALGESGSRSLSCSGRIKLCEDGSANCQERYFYAYTYQYAYFYRGELKSENHSFHFNGFFKDDFRLVRAAHDWIIYEANNYKIAVPWRTGADLYDKPIRELDSPKIDSPFSRFKLSRNGWQKLCPR